MRDSNQGDAIAAALDQLQLEQLASDDGSAVAERELRFSAVDGLEVKVQAWHVGDALWVRLAAAVDEPRAAAWLSQTKGAPKDLALVRARVADWNARFHGRRFQLPVAVATTLMLSHEQILAGAPAP
jgi:hypothetical protein